MKSRILTQSLIIFLTVFTGACDQQEKQAPASGDKSKPSANPNKQARQRAGETPPLNQIIDAMKKKQAGGLGTGSVKVNGAWTYTGYSFLDAVQGARLVAVDATVSGHTAAFDFDDIELVDGLNRTSYGSDPHITVLSDEGKPLTDLVQMPAPPGPARVLLIYGFPKKTQSFTLYYWGKNLLHKNHSIEPGGWELPFPKTEAN